MIKELKLSNSYKSTLVDEDIYDALFNKRLCLNSRGYVQFHLNGKTKMLHRFIVPCEPDMDIDHINRNPLDNRRENLRPLCRSNNTVKATRPENCQSKYKGVKLSKNKKRWIAQIKVEGDNKYGGTFNTELAAAKASQMLYDRYRPTLKVKVI